MILRHKIYYTKFHGFTKPILNNSGPSCTSKMSQQTWAIHISAWYDTKDAALYENNTLKNIFPIGYIR